MIFSLKYKEEWQDKLGELYFLKGLSMIDAGYCSDAIQFIKNLKIEDFKFVYLRYIIYIYRNFLYLATFVCSILCLPESGLNC